MAMSKRSGGEKQEDIWIAHTELAVPPGHPFYTRLNELLEGARFDEFVEGLCARFYHARLGRPSLRPGIYFRALLVGYFEGIDSERGIAWRVADSLALRRFLRIGLDERTPDHSTISRTRRLIDIDTADQGDTTTLDETLCEAGEQVAEQMRREAELRPQDKPKVHLQGIEELVTDKGYHSGAVVQRVKSYEVRSYIPEKKQKGRRDWQDKRAEQQAVCANRRRVRSDYGKSLLRRRGELIERSFAHCYETGGMRRCYLRGAGEHSATAVGTRGSVQLEPDSAKTAGSGYAARTKKPCWTGVFAPFALSANPDDGRFANLAVYSPGWPPHITYFSLPHISSSLAHSESFCHGLLA